MPELRFLADDDVRGIVSARETVEAVRSGYRQRGEGAPATPRHRLRVTDPSGILTGYTALLPETGYMGGYLYSAGFDSGDAWFVTPLFDVRSGEPVAIVDGAAMNPAKTGAAGAVGVDTLARGDATRLALIGSGVQARGQLLATASVRDLESVWVYSPTKEHREAFAAAMNSLLSATVGAVASSSAAIDGADIVITATTATEPVFEGDRLEPGTHVTAMGQYHPEKRELDASTIQRSTYVPDLRARVFEDAGSFLGALEEGVIDENHIHAELGEIVAGQEVGRSDPDEITVFDSGGTGIETVAVASLLYERANHEGTGAALSMAPASEAMEHPIFET